MSNISYKPSATSFPECGSGWHTDVCACVWGMPPHYVASCHGPKLHSNDSNESLPRATHQNKAIYLCVFQCVGIVHVFQSTWLPKTELGMWWKKRSWYLNMNISHSALGLGPSSSGHWAGNSSPSDQRPSSQQAPLTPSLCFLFFLFPSSLLAAPVIAKSRDGWAITLSWCSLLSPSPADLTGLAWLTTPHCADC